MPFIFFGICNKGFLKRVKSWALVVLRLRFDLVAFSTWYERRKKNEKSLLVPGPNTAHSGSY
jgi:hypothetical protein